MSKLEKKFTVTQGSLIKKEDAQVVGEELTALVSDGGLNVTQVLEAAKDPNSPLHRFVEWNDATAAHHWRMHRARELINSIQVIECGDCGSHNVDLINRKGAS